MRKKIRSLIWSLCTISLLVGCTTEVENKDIEKIIVSDTAADALLMDVEGLDNLDDIDALIEELSIVEALEEPTETIGEVSQSIAEETLPLVIEPPSEPIQTTSEHESVESVEETPDSKEKDQTSNFFGQIKRMNGKKLVIQIVRVEKIDRSILQDMTVEERRKALQNSVTYTDYYRTITYTDQTKILLNGVSVGSNQLEVGKYAHVAIARDGAVKTIRMANLRFK